MTIDSEAEFVDELVMVLRAKCLEMVHEGFSFVALGDPEKLAADLVADITAELRV